jgi:hypothetical protein
VKFSEKMKEEFDGCDFASCIAKEKENRLLLSSVVESGIRLGSVGYIHQLFHLELL